MEKIPFNYNPELPEDEQFGFDHRDHSKKMAQVCVAVEKTRTDSIAEIANLLNEEMTPTEILAMAAVGIKHLVMSENDPILRLAFTIAKRIG